MSEEYLPDIIYYNADLTNHQDNKYIKASYNVTRSDIILENPSLYYCSVVRFEVDGASIPLSIFPSLDNEEPNNAYYQVFIVNSDTALGYSEYVKYDSFRTNNEQNSFIPNSIWSIQSFLNMVNKAISVAFESMITAGTVPAGYLTGQAPYLYYDINTTRINLISPLRWADQKVLIYFNINLYEEFGDFFSVFVPSLNLYNIFIQNYGYNQANFIYDKNAFTAQSAGVASLITPSEYSTLYNMSVLRKILLISNSIPAVSEFTSTTSIQPSLTSQNTSQKILSDFIIPQDSAGSYRSLILYVPTSEYRIFDLIGNSKLNTIDLAFFWQDNTLVSRPMYLSPGATMNIKLMFRKKSFNGVKLYNEIKESNREGLEDEERKQGYINLSKQENELVSIEQGGNLVKIYNEKQAREHRYSKENRLPINKNASSNKKIPYELEGGNNSKFPTINNNSSSKYQIPRF